MDATSDIRTELIIVGDEILSGFTQDTNSCYLSRRLFELSLGVDRSTVVGDSVEGIEAAISDALSRSSLIVMTGGLGPTDDDVTKKAVSKAFNAPLILEEELVERVRARFSRRKISMPDLNINQGLLPRGAIVLENRLGTAPGLMIEQGDKLFFALPGVPVEMRAVFESGIAPILKGRFGGEPTVERMLKTTGIPESAIAERLGPILGRKDPQIRLAFLPNTDGVGLRMVFRGENRREGQRHVSALEAEIRQELGHFVYGSGGETMEQIVGYLLVLNNLTLAVAESCTGGLIGNRITNVPGSSSYFLGGAIAYSDGVKEKVLSVPRDLITSHGAVSVQVARAMASGVRRLTGSHLGLAVTGVAGPTGGSEEKPVGMVFIALDAEKGARVVEHRFLGEREEIKQRSAQAGLNLVRMHLIGVSGEESD